MTAPSSDTAAAGSRCVRAVPATSAVRMPQSSRCANVEAATNPNSTLPESRKAIATTPGTTPTAIDQSV